MSAVTVALGTDGASTNDNLDLHEVIGDFLERYARARGTG